MVNAVGGLDVRIPFRMRDAASGSNFRPGMRHLTGRGVLAFARDRHSVPGGDFGRQENGGRVFLAALTQFRDEYRDDPSRLLAWIGAGTRNMATDLPVPELIELAFAAATVQPNHVRNVVLPGGTGSVGGSSVAFLLRFGGLHAAPPAEALLFGLAIVGAAFAISWAAETAQLDISAGLAIAILALIAVLWIATLYSLTLPLKSAITLIDTLILVGLFAGYTWRVSRAPAEEPHLVGPARYLGTFPDVPRRAWVIGLFLASGVV